MAVLLTGRVLSVVVVVMTVDLGGTGMGGVGTGMGGVGTGTKGVRTDDHTV